MKISLEDKKNLALQVTVLLVNYKNWQDTIECVESILKSIHKKIEVIVVDNSPDNTSIQKMQQWAKGNIKIQQTLFPNLIFPEKTKPLDFISITEKEYYQDDLKTKKDILFIKAEKNNGFAAANNVVLKKIHQSNRNEDFIFLLNNDTVILPDTITNLITNYKNTNIGVAGCALIEYNEPRKIQSVGGLYNKLFGTTKQVLEGFDLEQFKNEKMKVHIDYPAGAAMFLSTKVLADIGILDEKYFLYYEELDWVSRYKQKYETTYFQNCFVFHKGGVSIGSNKKSYIADKYSIINRINYAKKRNRKNLLTIYIGVIFSLLKRLLQLKLTRSFNLIKDIIKNEN